LSSKSKYRFNLASPSIKTSTFIRVVVLDASFLKQHSNDLVEPAIDNFSAMTWSRPVKTKVQSFPFADSAQESFASFTVPWWQHVATEGRFGLHEQA
jgi:hypothetical protein